MRVYEYHLRVLGALKRELLRRLYRHSSTRCRRLISRVLQRTSLPQLSVCRGHRDRASTTTTLGAECPAMTFQCRIKNTVRRGSSQPTPQTHLWPVWLRTSLNQQVEQRAQHQRRRVAGAHLGDSRDAAVQLHIDSVCAAQRSRAE